MFTYPVQTVNNICMHQKFQNVSDKSIESQELRFFFFFAVNDIIMSSNRFHRYNIDLELDSIYTAKHNSFSKRRNCEYLGHIVLFSFNCTNSDIMYYLMYMHLSLCVCVQK